MKDWLETIAEDTTNTLYGLRAIRALIARRIAFRLLTVAKRDIRAIDRRERILEARQQWETEHAYLLPIRRAICD